MSSAKSWRAEAVFFFVTAQAFCYFLGAIAITLLNKAHVTGFKDLDQGFGPILVGTLCFQGATWILIPIFFGLQGIRVWDGLGLTAKTLVMAPLWAIGANILLLPAAGALEKASEWLMAKAHLKPHTEEAISLLTGATSHTEAIYLGIFAIVIAPVAEEFIFRGVLYTFIKQNGFPKTALISVSLLFALIHGDVAIFIPLFMLALVLTWLYEWTGSLAAPICTHALFNATNLILLNYATQ
ncbi:MAG TPA: CPBP family intramembrane glutamic endopeptidase [Verrucomicrobiae bacterium]|jgi:membrane protease YdiL (CAAX protease family)|nr:CPBP family intramembrane glutamic endopeptidase [Verrucomicrobiae bacterium]